MDSAPDPCENLRINEGQKLVPSLLEEKLGSSWSSVSGSRTASGPHRSLAGLAASTNIVSAPRLPKLNAPGEGGDPRHVRDGSEG